MRSFTTHLAAVWLSVSPKGVAALDSISHITTPKLHTSLFLLLWNASKDSGAIHFRGLPWWSTENTPLLPVICRLRPKSVNFAVKLPCLFVTRKFLAARSRCSMSCWCACDTPAAAPAASCTRSFTLKRLLRMNLSILPSSHSSSTIHSWLCVTAVPRNVTTLGCSASFFIKAASIAISITSAAAIPPLGWTVLTTTVSCLYCALYTTPNAPCPTSWPISISSAVRKSCRGSATFALASGG
mmetsp:Transcript_524/g.986  ORF Transcript_524/g.986 Transcript_524/m.986 type:complete len:241 (-) Transcript_524:1276-1998(-)